MSSVDWLGNVGNGIVRTVRPPQLRMTALVEKAIAEGGIVVIEAGTATGKSLAYATPALLSGKRTVISTAKKTLQQQLFQKDLPHLTSRLPVPNLTPDVPAYALLKGKGNYACKLRVEEFARTQAERFDPNAVRFFLNWVEGDPVGDLATFASADGVLPFEHLVSVQECVATSCPQLGACGYRRNKRAANKARVLVVNHALLAYDLAVGGGKMLGEYDVLIIDEAHQAPGYFRDAFTYRLSANQPDVLARMGCEVGDLGILYKALFHALPAQPGTFTLTAGLVELFTRLSFALTLLLRRLGAPEEHQVEGLDAPDVTEAPALDADAARVLSRQTSAARLVGRLSGLCNIVLGFRPAEEIAKTPYLTFLEEKTFMGKSSLELLVTPVEVGPLIAPGLLHIPTVVLTSATLATPSGFGYMLREFGLSQGQLAGSLVLPSPFDYRATSALYVSPTTPLPETGSGAARDAYLDVIGEELRELLHASKGGAFVLCASRADMVGLHAVLRRQLGPYELLVQGAQIDRDLAAFKANPHAVLLGMKSLWEGVDVPGLGLRLVVIPRLPFPNRGDVVLTARKARWIQRQLDEGTSQKGAEIRAFQEFDLQEALMNLKQGGGRLIRTETDRGVVALLDARGVGQAKGYSGQVRAAFPHPPTSDKALVLKFLGVLAGSVRGVHGVKV